METATQVNPNGQEKPKRVLSEEARANMSAGQRRRRVQTPTAADPADPMEQTAVDLVRVGRRVLETRKAEKELVGQFKSLAGELRRFIEQIGD
jgi:hypothetical protein